MSQSNVIALGPYSRAAERMADWGVAAIPFEGDDGKKPLLASFQRWRFAPSPETVRKQSRKYGSCNVGVVCGPSALLNIDLDDPSLRDSAETMLGTTPLVALTPRGGLHLYFRNADSVGCKNLREIGIKGDIKGVGGVAVCPPSIRPDTRVEYRWETQDWSAIPELPAVTRQQLQAWLSRISGVTSLSGELRLPIGIRNDSLFQHLRLSGPWPNFPSVLDEAQWFNTTQPIEPEPEAAVVATAESIWKYQTEGKLRTPWDNRVIMQHAAMNLIKENASSDYPLALALYIELTRQHGARCQRNATFRIAPNAMSEHNVIPGIGGRKRYERARDALLRSGLIVVVVPSIRQNNGQLSSAEYQLVHHGRNRPGM